MLLTGERGLGEDAHQFDEGRPLSAAVTPRPRKTTPEKRDSHRRTRSLPRSQSPARAGDQRVGAVAEHRHGHEDQAEHEELQRHRAPRRVDELGQEGEEEHGRLRVEHVDDDALCEQLPVRAPADLHLGQRLVARDQPPHAEEDQVRGAGELRPR